MASERDGLTMGAQTSRRLPITALAISVVGAAVLLLLVIIGAGFIPSPALDNDEAAFWDIIVKALGGVIALAGAAITASKYLDEKSQANEAARAANETAQRANDTARIEAHKPFDQQRQSIYLELLSTTARIGNTRHSTSERKEASDRFWFIYWRPLPLVADYIVGEAVNRFSELMGQPEDEIPLRNASLAIAQACRASLGYISPDGILPASVALPRLEVES